MHKTRILVLLAYSILLDACQTTAPFEWQEGDILFQDGDCGDFCEAIRKVTEGYEGRDFSHNGILTKERGEWWVLEAVNAGVKLTPLDTFLYRHVNEKGRPKVYVGRLVPTYRKLIPQALKHGKTLLGKPYDHTFDLDNDAYYCSELIHLSFQKANGGLPVFQLQPMTFIDPETGETFQVWATYFEKIRVPIPEGEPGLNPGGMTLDPAITMVHAFSEN
jgi:hypothetical protein